MKKKDILIFDTTPERRNAHSRALRNVDCNVFHYANGTIGGDPNTGLELPSNFDLILLHANDQGDFGNFTVSGPILHYGGDVPPNEATRVPRSVTAANPLSARELTDFCRHVFATPQKTVPEAIKLVWHSHEDVLALRLLCEAWQMTEGQNPKENPGTINGIQIHGPIEPKDWFAPFDIEFPDNASDEAKRKFIQERESLAKLMSGADPEAKALFDAVAAGKNEKDDLGKLIEAFLAKSKPSAKPAEK